MNTYEILYQNSRTGESFDITSLVSKPQWRTYRRGMPGAFEFEAIKWQEIEWQLGGKIIVKVNGTGIFYGYIVKIRRNEKLLMSFLCYDQLFYMKQNKETYKFTGKRADEITLQIAQDFKLKTGTMANTGYVIPKRIEDGQTLIDICLNALDLTTINTGKIFYLWDNFGALSISNVEDNKLDLLIGDGSLATGFVHEQDIESDTFNRIKLVKDNKETGRRDVYIVEDSNTQKYWGLLQYYEKISDDMNAAQITARAENLRKVKNRPKQSFTLNALADINVRGGAMAFIGVKEFGISKYHIVEECTHDLARERMSLRLKVM